MSSGWQQSIAIANTRWSIAGSALASLATSKLLHGNHFPNEKALTNVYFGV